MDWKDKLKGQVEEGASDAAQNAATDKVADKYGETAGSSTGDAIDAAKSGETEQFAEAQKQAAEQRVKDTGERKYAEGKESAANSVAEKYGNTAGGATGDAIDAARAGDADVFVDQQKAAAQGRVEDAATRKVEEGIANTKAKAEEKLGDKAGQLTGQGLEATAGAKAEDLIAENVAEKTDALQDSLAGAQQAKDSASAAASQGDALKSSAPQAPATANPATAAPQSAASSSASTTASGADVGVGGADTGAATGSDAASPAGGAASAGNSPVQAPMAIGAMNTLAIAKNEISVFYQVDINDNYYKNDEATLIQEGGDYSHTVCLGDLPLKDVNWVRLNFPKAPKEGSYTLMLDPKEGLKPYTIFKDIPYSDLPTIKH